VTLHLCRPNDKLTGFVVENNLTENSAHRRSILIKIFKIFHLLLDKLILAATAFFHVLVNSGFTTTLVFEIRHNVWLG